MLIMNIDKDMIINLEKVKEIRLESDYEGKIWYILIDGIEFEFYTKQEQAKFVFENMMNAYKIGAKTFVFPEEED